MSVLDEFGDPDRSTRAGWLARVAHALPAVVTVWLSTAVLSWLEILRLNEWPLWANLAYAVPLVAALLIGFAHMDLARLCLRCMEAVPADAPVRVRRHLRLLRLTHWAHSWRYFAAWLTLAIAVPSAVRWALNLDAYATTFLGAPGDLLVAAVLWGQWLHHRYRPWCPYCKRWDDGSGPRESSPTPDPAGVKTA